MKHMLVTLCVREKNINNDASGGFDSDEVELVALVTCRETRSVKTFLFLSLLFKIFDEVEKHIEV